ncbi:MAG: UDP-3-O-acyl-N-acetylglucosamine deacetylase, partial [Thermoguttaceae bacterium]|nr:UDP-3-O-acyl-N-acetylglucosamine deacetylase [Thermoguttaceae bacterium]
HFPNECARHKILDLIGDLALLGSRLRANVHAFRSGHDLNAQFVRTILSGQ